MADIVSPTAGDGEQFTVPFYINGKEVRAAKSFDVTSPATGQVVHRCSSASEVEVVAAVDAATRAFRTWKNTTVDERRDILLKAARLLDERRDELIGYMMSETGAGRPWGDTNVDSSKNMVMDIAGRISSLEGSMPATRDASLGAMVLREPYGVVLAMAPWNAPYILGIRSILSPIAAGNTVVFKGSEVAPRSMWAICSLFHDAGLPAGVLNYLVSTTSDSPAITATLIASPDVKKVNFTGSTRVGRIIGKLCGENLKPVLLELGGKAPCIVWEDCQLELAAMHCALGAFLVAGQVCMSTERILVHKAVRAAFETKLVAAIDKLFGAEAQVLISDRAAEKSRRLVRDAVAQGARIVYGEVGADTANKARMRPVVVADVDVNMELHYTESFGPTVALYEIETEEEALRIANDTEYGLSSAVFTEDLRRGLRLARGMESGAVHINHMTIHDEPALPHGGVKGSGYGRFNAAGLEEWVWTKTVTFMY